MSTNLDKEIIKKIRSSAKEMCFNANTVEIDAEELVALCDLATEGLEARYKHIGPIMGLSTARDALRKNKTTRGL